MAIYGHLNSYSYLKVGWINAQCESMKFTECKQSSDQVVNLTNCKAHAVHDHLAMLLHWGRAGTEVTPVGEVSLGLRVDHQHPAQSYTG